MKDVLLVRIYLKIIESGEIPVASEVQAEPKVEQVSSATQPAEMTFAPKGAQVNIPVVLEILKFQ